MDSRNAQECKDKKTHFLCLAWFGEINYGKILMFVLYDANTHRKKTNSVNTAMSMLQRCSWTYPYARSVVINAKTRISMSSKFCSDCSSTTASKFVHLWMEHCIPCSVDQRYVNNADNFRCSSIWFTYGRIQRSDSIISSRTSSSSCRKTKMTKMMKRTTVISGKGTKMKIMMKMTLKMKKSMKKRKMKMRRKMKMKKKVKTIHIIII